MRSEADRHAATVAALRDDGDLARRCADAARPASGPNGEANRAIADAAAARQRAAAAAAETPAAAAAASAAAAAGECGGVRMMLGGASRGAPLARITLSSRAPPLSICHGESERARERGRESEREREGQIERARAWRARGREKGK